MTHPFPTRRSSDLLYAAHLLQPAMQHGALSPDGEGRPARGEEAPPALQALRQAGASRDGLPRGLLLARVPEQGRHRQRSEEHTSETPVTNAHLVCRLLLEKKK